MHGENTFVKVYRYRIRPEQAARCLELQERAHTLYSQHIRYHVVHLRRQDDPAEWVEVHWYPDEETHRRGMELLAGQPEIRALWSEFLTLLDPPGQQIEPEYYERLRFLGDLAADPAGGDARGA